MIVLLRSYWRVRADCHRSKMDTHTHTRLHNNNIEGEMARGGNVYFFYSFNFEKRKEKTKEEEKFCSAQFEIVVCDRLGFGVVRVVTDRGAKQSSSSKLHTSSAP